MLLGAAEIELRVGRYGTDTRDLVHDEIGQSGSIARSYDWIRGGARHVRTCGVLGKLFK